MLRHRRCKAKKNKAAAMDSRGADTHVKEADGDNAKETNTDPNLAICLLCSGSVGFIHSCHHVLAGGVCRDLYFVFLLLPICSHCRHERFTQEIEVAVGLATFKVQLFFSPSRLHLEVFSYYLPSIREQNPVVKPMAKQRKLSA